jgi:NAD(P)-dependent dehydrogenase (short-subunit alcohol dehydrogenase family)
MNTLLVTGSNRGIGLEIVNQYAQLGWQVHACCRQPDNAHDLQSLAQNNPAIQVHALDISDEAQINALADKLKDISIDLLFNNAGIYGQQNASFGNTDSQQWLDCFYINCIAQLKMCEAFVDHVARSKFKTIASMSSKMGSMTDNGSGGSYVYRSSKAALNAVMKSASIDLKPRGIKVAILHPGWVLTDMGGPNAEISTAESVQQMRNTLERLTLDNNGGFFEIDGSIIPW